jgi:hypothetical protein
MLFCPYFLLDIKCTLYSRLTHIQRKHEGLPKGCLLEIRAGGKNMDKMFKVKSYLVS